MAGLLYLQRSNKVFVVAGEGRRRVFLPAKRHFPAKQQRLLVVTIAVGLAAPRDPL